MISRFLKRMVRDFAILVFNFYTTNHLILEKCSKMVHGCALLGLLDPRISVITVALVYNTYQGVINTAMLLHYNTYFNSIPCLGSEFVFDPWYSLCHGSKTNSPDSAGCIGRDMTEYGIIYTAAECNSQNRTTVRKIAKNVGIWSPERTS